MREIHDEIKGIDEMMRQEFPPAELATSPLNIKQINVSS
jgi:hypothetical protein